MKKAIILGVAPDHGLGAHSIKRFAAEGLHVFVASRTQPSLDNFVSEIEFAGGKTTAICADASIEDQVITLFEKVGNDLD